MKGLNDLYQAVADPWEYARKMKSGGKPVIGYFCSYTPDEIIYASGAHPMRLFGTNGEISAADAHLQAYSCSLVRGALENVLRGNLDFLDGTVFPHTCDSIQRLSDIWRLNTNFRFFADVVLPVKLDTDSAREYMVDVLRKFRRELAVGLGLTISDGDLEKSIECYNSIRISLKQIYELHSNDPAVISSRDLYTIVKASMIMDRGYLAARLPEIVDALKKGEFATDVSGKKRLILTGSICDHPDIYDILEKSGGVVVWDDLCTGSRYFDGLIANGPDPIERIATRYTERLICPAKHFSLTQRGENIVRIAREHKADGVIFLLLKFCDPHDFDYPYMKEFLDKEQIPNMLLEIEDQLPAEGQLLTRFETFMHML